MNKNVGAALAVFLFAFTLRIADIFLLRSPSMPRSIIISKIVPLIVLIWLVTFVEKKGVGYVGLTGKKLKGNLFLGALLVIITVGYNYVPDIIIFLIYKMPLKEPNFFFDVGMAYFLFFCIANGLAEEGIFRGYMQKKFYVLGKWNAIFIQAFLFGMWHVVWTFYNFYDFSSHAWLVTTGYVVQYTIGYVFFSFIFGLVMGYAFSRTGSLWGPVLCHTFYNFLLGFLYFNDTALAEMIKFVGYPIMGGASLLLIRYIAEKTGMEEDIA